MGIIATSSTFQPGQR